MATRKNVRVCTHCGSECPFRNLSTPDGTVVLCWDCMTDDNMATYGFSVGMPAPSADPAWVTRLGVNAKELTR
jgi:hypothetical protein